jgi:uncharacterized protein (TIGR00251 family)
MKPPAFLEPRRDHVLLRAHVQPRASRNGIGKVEGIELKIKVTAPPVDAAANDAVVKLLAGTLDIPKSRVVLVRGKTSRHKVFTLHGIDIASAATRLGAGAP